MFNKLPCHAKQVLLLCKETTEQELMQLGKIISSGDTISDYILWQNVITYGQCYGDLDL